jgi:hypothetical protein
MQDSNTENTIPTEPNHDKQDTVPLRPMPPYDEEPQSSGFYTISKPSSRPKRWPWILVGLLMIFLFVGAGSWMGYQSALKLRSQQVEEQRVTVASDHFMAGLVAQSNKQYEIARQQFEFVIRTDPNFPGAQDKLREVMIEMSMDRTPTPAPTVFVPTMTPTKDLRPQEEIFATAKQQLAAKEWDALFNTIDSLRQIDPKYRSVEIDGMLYMALRFRGIEKILHHANLEGGLYDLALAERFGPLDIDAMGYRVWARQYLNGASFWEVDWVRVMQYFEEIYPSFPNMRDSSGMTAIERYRIAARSHGDKLMIEGDGCGAYEYYQKSLNAVADGALEEKAQQAYLVCYPPTPTPTETLPVTPTVPVVTDEPPPVEPTADVETPPTAEPLPDPTEEPVTE